MKIRLVIPECKKFSGGYSKNSVDIDQRLEILKIATQESDKIGLIVTSHNFFGFNPNIKVNDFDAKKFIIKNIVPNLQEKIENKKPLVIGFDLLKLRFKHPKKQKSKGKDKGAFNPYHGIDSIVCYIKVKNNSYVYQTHIWECWQSEGECNPVYFEKQNKNRVFSLDNKLIGLLSCGDISNSCHDYGKLLQEVDVYLDLSHYSLRGDTSQRKVSPKLVGDEVTAEKIRKYIEYHTHKGAGKLHIRIESTRTVNNQHIKLRVSHAY